MNKRIRSFAMVTAIILSGLAALAQASPSGVVISQVYGGGGNSGATWTHDFIELFNAGNNPADISGWSVQYASYHGTSWNNITTIPSGITLQPGQYYLIQESAGSGNGSALPTADLTGGINMSGSHGKVALVTSGTPLSGACPLAGAEDFVGYDSSGTNGCSEGNMPTASLSNSTAAIRQFGGCTDTNINADDFDVATPTPRNTASAFNVCIPVGNQITLSVANASLAEGNTGSVSMDFTVSLSRPAATGGVNFDIATSDQSTQTADADYVATAVTGASIAAGDTSYTFSVQINGDTIPEPDETFLVTVSNVSGTNVITTTATATGTLINDDGNNIAIHVIQSADMASPWAGSAVHTQGIVTALAGNGFFLQTADNATDGDPLTSEGIFVFNPSPTVAVGDKVSLDADVFEYFGLTELKNISNLVVASSGNPLPTAVVFDDTLPSTDPALLSCGATNFECFEGMRIQVADGVVTEGTTKYDEVFVTATGERSMREPGLLYGLSPIPGDNAAVPVWDGNPEVFKMLPGELPGAYAGGGIHGGATFAATGVLTYDFGSYTLLPTSLTITNNPVLPRPAPDAGAGVLRIASFNVERYCDDIDDTVSPGTALVECSGGSLPTTAEYDTKAQRLEDYIATVLQLPDVVALQEVENITVLTRLADKLNIDYGTSYTAHLLEGNDIGGIDVGYLINSHRVNVLSVMQLDKYLMWRTPNNHNRPVFDHPPLLLQGIFTGGGQAQPFLVMVNHLKARQDVDDTDASGNPTGDALEDQQKRFRQAYAVAMLIQDLQSSDSTLAQGLRSRIPSPLRAKSMTRMPLVVVGDFNAYQFSDGFADTVGLIRGTYDFAANTWDLSDLTAWSLEPVSSPLADSNVVDPPLWDAVASLPADEQYSYLFPVNFGTIQGGSPREVPTDQVLDHALLNQAARNAFLRMDYARANLDGTWAEYDTSTGPMGVSDHDGFVLQFAFDIIFQDGFEPN